MSITSIFPNVCALNNRIPIFILLMRPKNVQSLVLSSAGKITQPFNRVVTGPVDIFSYLQYTFLLPGSICCTKSMRKQKTYLTLAATYVFHENVFMKCFHEMSFMKNPIKNDMQRWLIWQSTVMQNVSICLHNHATKTKKTMK